MEKRVFIAVLISFVFLFAWASLVGVFFPDLVKKKPAAQAEKRVTSQAAPAPAKRSTPAAAAVPAPVAAAQPGAPAPAPSTQAVAATAEKKVVVDRPLYRAVVSNRGGELISFQLKNYTEKNGSMVDLVRTRPAGSVNFPFAIESGDPNLTKSLNSALYETVDDGKGNVTFRFAQGGVSATKSFSFADDFQFRFRSEISGTNAPYRVIVGPGIKTLTDEERDNKVIITGNGLVQTDNKLKVIRREKASKLESYASPDYIGIEDNYFLTVLRPRKTGDGLLRAIDSVSANKKKERDLYVGLNSTGGIVETDAFFGPKEAELLEKVGLEKALQFGFFGFIAKVLLKALVWMYGVTKNYGWAIVLLTIIIKVILYPLQHKSMVSMKKMQKLQPKVNSLKEKYKKSKTDPDQRQKLNAEIMKLYQVEGVSPMSGCLPIFMQLPILWAFYSLLSRAIELRGAPFIWWIHDLSLKDPYYLTPILMTATMLIQQQMTPSTADPVQKKMFLMMPIVFGFIFKDFPSGLVLYWLVQNILTIIQQLIMNRYWKEHPESLTENR